MADDIIPLRHSYALSMVERISELEAEVERLRAALALAIGELSTYGPMRYTSPDQLMEHFMEEARRG